MQVPITLYFMTHAYFCFYHAISNLLIRRLSFAIRRWRPSMQHLATALLVLSLSYATAFMETLTIAHFPYYTFKVRSQALAISRLSWQTSQHPIPILRWCLGPLLPKP